LKLQENSEAIGF